jgi:RNA-binding protein YhbY
MDTSIQDKIADRLRRQGRGKVFTPKDFLDLGGREAVDKALSRLAKIEIVQRLGRGLYCYPQVNKRLGIAVPPDVDEIADALARQTGSRIAPSGATAANRLGLSTQVPAKPVYLTDGRSRQVKVGNFVIVVKHVPPKELPIGNRTSATVMQALRHLGKDGVDASVLSKIRKTLTAKHRSRLLQDARYTTDWIADAVRKIAGKEVEAVSHG